MAYSITCLVNISYVPDGAGPVSIPSMQTFTVALGSGPWGTPGTGVYDGIQVPGGNAPSTGNVSTACTNMATAVATQLNANIGTIQGWATGGQ